MLRALRPGTERKIESMTVSIKPALMTSTRRVAGAVKSKMLNFCWMGTLKDGHCSLAFSLRPTS